MIWRLLSKLLPAPAAWLPILKGHKCGFQGSTVVHRICEEPEAYAPSRKEA